MQNMTPENKKILDRINAYAETALADIDPQKTRISFQLEALKPVMEEIAAENREYINYSTPQSQVLENLPDEIKNDPVQYPDAETLERCQIYKDLGDMASKYDEFWTRIIVN